jgi:mannose-1-phosphate guanylyltransferase
MKAFLLAAGKGTRLRPLTDRIPKCLVPIAGRPLLAIWLDALAGCGVDEVLVNTHHLADQVERFVRAREDAGHPPRVRLFHEPELLGSAGTVLANRDFIAGEDRFFVLYADNLTTVDLTALDRFHREKSSPFTMGLFQTPEPRECGVAVCDADGRIVDFQEKPKAPKSDWANAGLYVAAPSVLDAVPDKPICDFGFDVLPRLVGKMYGYRIRGFFCDTGTPERLERARRGWPLARVEESGQC